MKEITVDELYITKEIIYGLNYECSALIKFNANTYEAMWGVLITVDEKKLRYNSLSEMYRHLIIIENWGYLIGYCTNRVVKINLETKQQKVIILKFLPEVLHIIGHQENMLYIYAVYSARIIAVNVLNEMVHYYKLPDKFIGKINSGEMKLYDKYILITGYLHNSILRFDCLTGKIEEHTLDDITEDICLCASDRRYLIFTSQKEVLFWDINYKCIKNRMLLPEEVLNNGTEMPFYKSFIAEDKLILIPFHTASLLQININTFEVQNVYVLRKETSTVKMRNFGYLDRIGKCVYGMNNEGEQIILNLETGKIEKISFYIPYEMLGDIKEQIFALPNDVMVEGKELSILEIMDHLNETDEEIKKPDVGEKIYKIC